MMRFMVREPGLEPEHLVNGYPWAELGEATVVDLGGSHGAVSLCTGPQVPFIKTDRPGTWLCPASGERSRSRPKAHSHLFN